MQTNPAVEQSKIIRWFESPWNQSSRKGKGLWRIYKFVSRVRGLSSTTQNIPDPDWVLVFSVHSNTAAV